MGNQLGDTSVNFKNENFWYFSRMINIVLFGTGNLATHLFKALSKSSIFQIIQVYNHQQKSLDKFSQLTHITTQLNEIKEAEIYLLALKDEVIAEIAEKIPSTNALVVHTSGGTELEILKKFPHRGIFYPLQTFSKNKEVDFAKVPICLETNLSEDMEILKKFAGEFSKEIFILDSNQRKAVHAAAVFVSNFVNLMYTEGAEICTRNNIPFEILQPLIEETSNKIKVLSPLEAQTGPALRNDQRVIENHLKLLNENQQQVYKLLTASIQNYHGKKL